MALWLYVGSPQDAGAETYRNISIGIAVSSSIAAVFAVANLVASILGPIKYYRKHKTAFLPKLRIQEEMGGNQIVGIKLKLNFEKQF